MGEKLFYRTHLSVTRVNGCRQRSITNANSMKMRTNAPWTSSIRRAVGCARHRLRGGETDAMDEWMDGERRGRTRVIARASRRRRRRRRRRRTGGIEKSQSDRGGASSVEGSVSRRRRAGGRAAEGARGWGVAGGREESRGGRRARTRTLPGPPAAPSSRVATLERARRRRRPRAPRPRPPSPRRRVRRGHRRVRSRRRPRVALDARASRIRLAVPESAAPRGALARATFQLVIHVYSQVSLIAVRSYSLCHRDRSFAPVC